MTPPPTRLASPFAKAATHPHAREAAEALQQQLETMSLEALDAPQGGKMFGVLVAAASDGSLTTLKAFSGMLRGGWLVEGFSPPLFDPAALDAFWPAAEKQLRALDPALQPARSRELLRQIRALYVVTNARGETRSLPSLFAPLEPPGGAGDCAAPKLFAEAFARRLQPVALAEFWWGASSPGGERRRGEFHPSCREKCGVVLPFMLQGLEVEPAPAEPPREEPRIVFEDAQLLVVEKPCGLLVAPGRHEPTRDSVLVRLQREDLLPVMRLEAEASGLLLLAKDAGTLATLQRQLSQGELVCQYAAWIEGALEQESGVVEGQPRGKPARTEWRVVERRSGRTRVTLTPRTDRAGQLLAAAQSLGAGIVREERLLLHAARLSFVDRESGARREFESPAPF